MYKLVLIVGRCEVTVKSKLEQQVAVVNKEKQSICDSLVFLVYSNQFVVPDHLGSFTVGTYYYAL